MLTNEQILDAAREVGLIKVWPCFGETDDIQRFAQTIYKQALMDAAEKLEQTPSYFTNKAQYFISKEARNQQAKVLREMAGKV